MRSLVVFVLLSILTFAFAVPLRPEDFMQQKRDVQPEWEDLGWAWGKRSDPTMPRSWMHKPMKKNPEWHDLGWTWGRK